MTTQTNDQAKVVGGPEDNSKKIETNEVNSNKKEETQKKWVTASGKEFNTPEELNAYTAGLEEELVRKAFQNTNTQAPAPQVQKPATWEEEVAESMFTDPVGTLRKVKEKVTEEIRNEDVKKDAARSFWDHFYKENPDLQNTQKIVALVSKELSQDPAFGRLPAAQVSKRLADEVRMAIKDIPKGGETETVINGKPAPMFSGSNPVQKTASAPAKPKTFVDQVREMKAKRKAAV